MSVLLKPYGCVEGLRGQSRFFLSDCVDVFRQLRPQSVDVIVSNCARGDIDIERSKKKGQRGSGGTGNTGEDD